MIPVSIVIPAINEADNLAELLPKCYGAAQIVVVDGGSTDATVAIARDHGAEVIIDHTPGKGHAMRRGFSVATQPYIIAMDADGSMCPSEIPLIVDALDAGADFVKGSRYLGGSHDLTLIRSAGNKFLTGYFNYRYGTKYTDLCYGYLAFRKEALVRIRPRATGFEIEAELIARASKVGLDVTEFPSVEYARLYGASNLKPVRDGFRVLREINRHA